MHSDSSFLGETDFFFAVRLDSSYFVSTAGNICTETVKKYIEQQRD
jgi:REP element-mobilizing transposase RayT